MKPSFTDQNIIDLLKAVKNHRCLWAIGTKEHKDRTAREAAFLEVFNSLNIPGLTKPTYRKKMWNIKQYYKQERERVLRASKRGKIYEPKVSWYHIADSFLRETLANEEKAWEEKHYAKAPENLKTKMVNKCYVRKKYITPAKKSSVPAQENEFDVFGRSVAMQLKTLPICQALELQLGLQSAITKQRIAFYTKEAVSTMPSSSTNEPCSSFQAHASDTEGSLKIKAEDTYSDTDSIKMEYDIEEESVGSYD